METTITMTTREQRRAWVLTRVLKDELTMAEAAETLGLSERQLWRLRVAFERHGPAGLVHGNRGRPSGRRLDGALRERVVELRRTTYGEVNDTHLAELLAEREGIEISRPSLQRILRAAGLASPRRRRPPRHRSRRARMAAEGLLLQLDGSRHDWLEGEATPDGWSRPTSGSTARSSPSMVPASSPFGPRRRIRPSSAPRTASGPSPGSSLEPLRCPGCRQPIIPGGGSGRAPSSTSSD
jgi:transposase